MGRDRKWSGKEEEKGKRIGWEWGKEEEEGNLKQ
jgi:hypothetical protein